MMMSRLDMFLIMLLMNFIEETVIKQTSERLHVPLTTQEYIKWIGCWLYMSCWVGIGDQRDWLSTTAPSRHKGTPFRLNDYMSRTRFENILAALQHTDCECKVEDGFHLMQQWEEAWNKKMEDDFFFIICKRF